jgi:hypothetical protein
MRCLPVALLLIAPLPLAQAQNPHPHVPAIQTHDTAAPREAALPVTRVSLYKNGVGFFEHTGSVSGNASVTINFTSGQLDDVLQSLTAIDLNGGRISGAGYNSTTPLDQQLKNLPLALSADPTAADFYAAIRGTRVEAHSGAISITGRLLSVESRDTNQPAGTDGVMAQRQFITVVADNGETRTLELTPATSVKLLDTTLHTDVNRYLQLLDSTRSQGLRHLTLQDNGAGPRELHLSYISEVPIWKSTYRILFTDASKSPSTQTATLQGWSVVDNTTGTDWINVHLSLIAGAPQSFIQPLSQPIYSRRPEIPIAQEAELTPQTFDSSNATEVDDALASPSRIAPAPPSPMMAMKRNRVAGMAGMAGGAPGGVFGGLATGSGSGIGPGSGGNTGGSLMHIGGAPPISYEETAEASLTPSATTAGFDDFFSYNLTEPVTILKNESALVPILQAKVDADRVTLVSSDGSTVQQPLRALWITNSSGLTLDRGSFTIVEDGNFGGEGLLDPIHAGEKRLLSYAADQAVQVSTEDDHNTEHIAQVTASKGILKLHHADVREITYIIHNAAANDRTIVLEQPIFAGYKLDSDVQATETTPTVYRFRQDVPAGQTTRLHVAEKHQGVTDYRLTTADDNQLTFILNETSHNAKLEAALQPILDARRRVANAQLAVDQINAHLNSLRADEDRQRANITALQHADKSSGDRFVKDLNKTEDAITAAQSELTTRTTALDAAKANLSNLIESFQIDETI